MHRILENCVGSYSLNEYSVPEPHGRGDTWGTMAVEKGGPWLGTNPIWKPKNRNHQNQTTNQSQRPSSVGCRKFGAGNLNPGDSKNRILIFQKMKPEI